MSCVRAVGLTPYPIHLHPRELKDQISREAFGWSDAEKDAASLDLNRGRAPGMLIGSNFGALGPITRRRTHTKEMGPQRAPNLVEHTHVYFTFDYAHTSQQHPVYDVCLRCCGLRVVFAVDAVIIFQPRAHGVLLENFTSHTLLRFAITTRDASLTSHLFSPSRSRVHMCDWYFSFFGFCLRRHIPHKSSDERVYLLTCARGWKWDGCERFAGNLHKIINGERRLRNSTLARRIQRDPKLLCDNDKHFKTHTLSIHACPPNINYDFC